MTEKETFCGNCRLYHSRANEQECEITVNGRAIKWKYGSDDINRVQNEIDKEILYAKLTHMIINVLGLQVKPIPAIREKILVTRMRSYRVSSYVMNRVVR
jgi:hypothetical protein